MSVIALTTVGPTPSVVTDQGRFHLDGDAIHITGADMPQLDGTVLDCNASYDLRVGGTYREHREQSSRTLGPEEVIRLRPGNAVLIETEEWVHFPRRRFGEILPKVTLLQRGMANTPSKVDPGYQGHLVITVFNHGKRTIPLRRLDRFCSLHVFDVIGDVRPYNKGGKQIVAMPTTRRWQRFLDWLDKHRMLITLFRTLFVLAAVVLSLIALLRHP